MVLNTKSMLHRHYISLYLYKQLFILKTSNVFDFFRVNQIVRSLALYAFIHCQKLCNLNISLMIFMGRQPY